MQRLFPSMPRIWRALRILARARSGSAAVEFALLGPMFVLMMFAVFQFSITMQNYSALGSAAADVQRKIIVENQSGNTLTTSQMRDTAIGTATLPPYLLRASALTVTVEQAGTQRVTGTMEYTMTMSYQTPLVVWPTTLDFTINYTRAIFLKV